MPSVSKKQSNFMRMCSSPRGRANATKKCPPKSVAREYAAADAGRRKKR